MQKKVLPILFATLLIDMIGVGMIIPIIPVLFTDPTSPSFLLHGFTTEMQYLCAGLITALYGFMQFVGAPILGELSDAYGRKKLLILGVATLAVSQLVFGFGIETASVLLLFIARAIAGLAAANFSIAQAAIADVSESKDRAKNFGLIGAAFGIGFILGPLLSGYIAGALGDPAAPFWFAGMLGIVNVVFVSLFLPETNKNRTASRHFHLLKGVRNIQAAFQDKDARPVYSTNFLYMCGFSFFVAFSGVFLVERFGFKEADIGTFFGAIGLCVVVTQLLILRVLTKKYRERQILKYSILTVAAMMFLYPFIPTVPFAYFLIPFIAVPQALTMANMTALVSKSVSPEKQGAALGINGSLLAFSQGVIPFIAGFGAGALGIGAPFIAAGLFMVASWWMLFVYAKMS